MKPEFTGPVLALWNKICPPNSKLKNLIVPLTLIMSKEMIQRSSGPEHYSGIMIDFLLISWKK